MQCLLKIITRYGLGISFQLVAIQLPGSLPQPDFVRSVARKTIEQKSRICQGHSYSQDELGASQPIWEGFQYQSDRKRTTPCVLDSAFNHEQPVVASAAWVSDQRSDLQLNQLPWQSPEKDSNSKRKRTMNVDSELVQNLDDSRRKLAFQRSMASDEREDEALFPRPFVFNKIRTGLGGGPACNSKQPSGKQDELVEFDLLSRFRGVRAASPTSDQTETSTKLTEEGSPKGMNFQPTFLQSAPAFYAEGFQSPYKRPFHLEAFGNDPLGARSFFLREMPEYRTESTSHQAEGTPGSIETTPETGRKKESRLVQDRSQDVRTESHQLDAVNQVPSTDVNHMTGASDKELHHSASQMQVSPSVEAMTGLVSTSLEDNPNKSHLLSNRQIYSGRNIFELNNQSSRLKYLQIFQEHYSTIQKLPEFSHEVPNPSKLDTDAGRHLVESHQELPQTSISSMPPPVIRVDMEVVTKGLFQEHVFEGRNLNSDTVHTVEGHSQGQMKPLGEFRDHLTFVPSTQRKKDLISFIESLKKISGSDFFKNQPHGKIWTNEENAHILLESYDHYKQKYLGKKLKDPGEEYSVLTYFSHLAEEESQNLGLIESIESFIEILTLNFIDSIKTNQIYVPNTPYMHSRYWFVTKVVSQVRDSCKGLLLLVRLFEKIFKDERAEAPGLRETQYKSWEFLKIFWNDFIMFQREPVQKYNWIEGSNQDLNEIQKKIYWICKHLSGLKKEQRTVKGLTIKLFSLWLETNQRSLYERIGRKIYFVRNGWISLIFHILHFSCT